MKSKRTFKPRRNQHGTGRWRWIERSPEKRASAQAARDGKPSLHQAFKGFEFPPEKSLMKNRTWCKDMVSPSFDIGVHGDAPSPLRFF
jgi:hypothetical protein